MLGYGGAPNLITITRYNPAGQVIESRTPKANGTGTDAHTTVTSYYTATGSAPCGGQPGQAGLVCSTAPAAQPPDGAALPTTTTTYDMYSSPRTVTDTVAVTGGSASRTTTTTYDNAGRAKTVAVTTSGPSGINLGDAVATTTYGYDSDTGLQTSVATPAGTITTSYDTLGRPSSISSTGTATTGSTTGYDIDGHVASVNDGKHTTTYSYDGSSEHRGLLTGLISGTTAPGTFAASYDADGNLVSQTYPNGLIASSDYDAAGNRITLSYTMPGSSTPWLTYNRTLTIGDQVRSETGTNGTQTYGYDNSGRLTRTADQQPGADPGVDDTCTTRSYGYDPDGNRTSLTTTSGTVTGSSATGCAADTLSSNTTVNRSYDTADRLTGAGYSYDPFGRTLTVPAADAGGNDTTLGYYTTDMVSRQTNGSKSRTYSLDPAGRIAGWTNSTNGSNTGSSVNHYIDLDGAAGSAWTSNSDNTWTRNIPGVDSNLAAIETSSGSVTLQLINLHGDAVASVDDTSSATSPSSVGLGSDEFGNPRGSTGSAYSWLGGDLRSSDTLGASVLMGVRLYQPALGRFLQVDPVSGGSLNAYDYANQDPINQFDFSGTKPQPQRLSKDEQEAYDAWKAGRPVRDQAALRRARKKVVYNEKMLGVDGKVRNRAKRDKGSGHYSFRAVLHWTKVWGVWIVTGIVIIISVIINGIGYVVGTA